MKKTILSVLMILVLVTSGTSAFAFNGYECDAAESGITRTEKDGSYITAVSAEFLDEIRLANIIDNYQSYGYRRTFLENRTEMNKEVLKAIGYDDDDFLIMGDDEVNYLANNAESMVITETYYRIDESGNAVVVSLDEYNNAQVSLAYSSENDAEKSEEVDEGWFCITTTAVYLDPSTQNGEIGWYTFSGHFEWLSMPNYRMIDAASLGFNVQLEWSNENTDFSSTRLVKYKYYGEAEVRSDGVSYASEDAIDTSYKGYGDLSLCQEGLYCEWQLPSNILDENYQLLYEYTGIEIYLRGKARIGFYNYEQGFTVYSRYEHTYSSIAWQPSFSWDSNVLGVVAGTFSWVNNSDTYSSHCGVTYDPSASSERG